MTSEDVSPSEVVDGNRYPKFLSETEHPIIWIQVKDEYDPQVRREILQKMRKLVLGKLSGSNNKG